MKFKLQAKIKPAGDQPRAIKELVGLIHKNKKYQTLLGVTGSGKTFTVANVIAKIQRPVLVIAHNKTLAAQLVQEFRDFFPKNAVEYFVSYYDYYQPEAYIPTSDTYIEKDASINDEIDRMRGSATSSLVSRRDVIVVCSVSCIYGLGNPINYKQYILKLGAGQIMERDDLAGRLVDIGYSRSEDMKNGTFRLRGLSAEIASPFGEAIYRIDFRDEKIQKIQEFAGVSRDKRVCHENLDIFPARHFVVSPGELERSIPQILKEMRRRVKYFLGKKLYLEAERLERRVTQDMVMLREVGYVSGIENYSRYLTGREPGEAPYTLLDYFGDNFLTVVDESHVTLPQLGGMFEGDYSRKKNLVKYGFRLPSAFDNRPLRFEEFTRKTGQIIFTSATPGQTERKKSVKVVEQIIRPTGLLDPKLIIRKSKNQIKNIVEEIKTMPREERVLITTLTKKMAEELADYLKEKKIKACYLHSGVETLDRIRILNNLRRGKYQVLVGVNLLREGLDLPEVTLVGILDADSEGFLRNETSLIQTMGRAARNVKGRVILYCEKITRSIEAAARETGRRRKKQMMYNKKYGITPKTIKKGVRSIAGKKKKQKNYLPREYQKMTEITDIQRQIKDMEKEMEKAADNLEFERAIAIRDELGILKKISG
ncbi:MAG: excinuclease ABC subunit UvrB [Patescibacteria group bacterium]